jgi:hypothetical protein
VAQEEFTAGGCDAGLGVGVTGRAASAFIHHG